MLVIIWTDRDFCIISDSMNLLKTNLKTYEKGKHFFHPANTHSSSEEFIKEKRHKFTGVCSLFTCFNMQILNLHHRWHSVHNPLKYLKWSVL